MEPIVGRSTLKWVAETAQCSTKTIFWVSTGFVLYAYLGYPLLLWVTWAMFRRPLRKQDVTPSISLLILAYNEAAVIGAKISNSLALDYPAEKLEIVIASDGSTYTTAKIVRSFVEDEGKGRVRLLEFCQNRGKIGALNDAVPQLRGGILVFSDASSMLAPESFWSQILRIPASALPAACIRC